MQYADEITHPLHPRSVKAIQMCETVTAEFYFIFFFFLRLASGPSQRRNAVSSRLRHEWCRSCGCWWGGSGWCMVGWVGGGAGSGRYQRSEKPLCRTHCRHSGVCELPVWSLNHPRAASTHGLGSRQGAARVHVPCTRISLLSSAGAPPTLTHCCQEHVHG